MQDEPAVEMEYLRPKKRPRRPPKYLQADNLIMHDKRLRDILPQPLAALPPTGLDVPDSSLPHSLVMNSPSSESCNHDDTAAVADRATPGVLGRLRRVLETTRNPFGLFRRYLAEKFPSHDPDGELRAADLSDVADMLPGKTASDIS